MWTIRNIIVQSLSFFLIILILFSNGHVLALFIRSKKIRKNPNNWLVLNLVIAEGFGSCLYVPNITTILLTPDLCVRTRHVVGFVTFNLFTFSMLGLTSYQFIKIVKPLTFFNVITTFRVKCYIILCWLVSIAISIHPFIEVQKVRDTGVQNNMTYNYEHNCITRNHTTIQYMIFMSLGIMAPAVVVIVSMQIIIFIIVRRHLTKITNFERSTENTRSATFSTNTNEVILTRFHTMRSETNGENSGYEDIMIGHTPCRNVTNENHVKGIHFFKLEHFRQTMKSFKVLAIVGILFIFGWLPVIIIAIILVLCRSCYTVSLSYILVLCTILSCLTSIMNPWLFSLRLPDFKFELQNFKQTMHFWAICCCCPRSVHCLSKLRHN